MQMFFSEGDEVENFKTTLENMKQNTPPEYFNEGSSDGEPQNFIQLKDKNMRKL